MTPNETGKNCVENENIIVDVEIPVSTLRGRQCLFSDAAATGATVEAENNVKFKTQKKLDVDCERILQKKTPKKEEKKFYDIHSRDWQKY